MHPASAAVPIIVPLHLAHVSLVGSGDDALSVDALLQRLAGKVAAVLEGVQRTGAVREGAAELATGHALAALCILAVGSCTWLAGTSSTVASHTHTLRRPKIPFSLSILFLQSIKNLSKQFLISRRLGACPVAGKVCCANLNPSPRAQHTGLDTAVSRQ